MNKQELIELVNELLQEDNLEDRKEDLKYLKRQYDYLLNRDEDSFFEKQETDRFLSAFSELAKKEPKLLRSAYDEKKDIIEEAKKLLDRKDILVANKELDKLSEDFKRAGRTSSKEKDDELWAEFRQVKDEFYSRKRTYFDELNAANDEKRNKKRDIIERAKQICEIENVKEANEKMNALRQEWKQVGYAGKGDEALWREFAKAMDEFQEKKKERHQEMLKTFEDRAAKKEELIKEAKILLADSDFSDEEIARIKKLRSDFRAVGFAGKEKDDDLYNRFNEVIDKYFEEKKFYKD